MALQLAVGGETPDHQVVLPGRDLEVLDPAMVPGHTGVGVLNSGLDRLRNLLKDFLKSQTGLFELVLTQATQLGMISLKGKTVMLHFLERPV